MDINCLRYLVDVGQTKSITLSAKRLFISQQGLSQIILRLENDLKISLLNRHRQGVTLTEAGEVLVEKAKDLLDLYENMLQAVRPYAKVNSQNLSGKLTISVVPFISSNILPEVLDTFHKKFPDVDVHIQENQPEIIISDINECQVDMGLVILPEYQYNNLILSCTGTYEQILESGFFAVVASNSPLAKKKVITVSELYQQPIVLYNFDAYLRVMGQMFQDIKHLKILAKTNSVDLYKNTLLNRQAVGITTSIDTRLLSDNSLVTIPIKDSIKMFYGCFVPSSCSMSKATESFINLLKSHVATLLNRRK